MGTLAMEEMLAMVFSLNGFMAGARLRGRAAVLACWQQYLALLYVFLVDTGCSIGNEMVLATRGTGKGEGQIYSLFGIHVDYFYYIGKTKSKNELIASCYTIMI
jgi:hypothetical protein